MLAGYCPAASEAVADQPGLSFENFPGDGELLGRFARDHEALILRSRIGEKVARPSERVAGPAGRIEKARAAEIVVKEIREMAGGFVEAPQFKGVELIGRIVVPAEGEPGAAEVRRDSNARGDGLF